MHCDAVDHHAPGPVDQPQPTEPVGVNSDEGIDPLVERRDGVLSDAVTADGGTDLRSCVCNLCDEATETTCRVGAQTHVRVSGRRCPVVRAGCRTCLESNGKPCPVVWRYVLCTKAGAAASFSTNDDVPSWSTFGEHVVVR